MRGRNSEVISVRVSEEVYGVVLEEAEKRGVSVGELVKRKVEAWVDSINAMKAKAPAEQIGKANPGRLPLSEVYGSPGGYAVKLPLALYNPLVHKAGDRVLVKVGGKLKEAVVPELDGDGREMPI